MAEFILFIVVLVVCGLIFGKADTKKDILNNFGLDLSQNVYESKKESEYRKYVIKAMKNAVNLDSYKAKDESEFLRFLENKLWDSIHGYYVDDSFYSEKKELNLGVKNHYTEHARTVISRRLEDIEKGNLDLLIPSCDFTNKNDAKHYCEILWNKYQYPWPEDWMKKDSAL